jgi:hypothetical protein
VWSERFVISHLVYRILFQMIQEQFKSQKWKFVGQDVYWVLNCHGRECREIWNYLLIGFQACQSGRRSLMAAAELRAAVCHFPLQKSDTMFWEDPKSHWQLQIPRWIVTFVAMFCPTPQQCNRMGHRRCISVVVWWWWGGLRIQFNKCVHCRERTFFKCHCNGLAMVFCPHILFTSLLGTI